MAKKTSRELTAVEEFYIKSNMNSKTIDELVADTAIEKSIIENFINNSMPRDTRIKQLMIREKGCVIMTAEASAASDDLRNHKPLEGQIQAAVARKDYVEAERLQKQQAELQRQQENILKTHQSKHIHYIK